MVKLSAPQQAIYDYMKQYQLAKGYPPSVREICTAVGLRSTSTVHGHLTRLERKGLLRRDPTKPRAIEIVELQQSRSKTYSLPVVGRVTAGTPILAQQDIEEYMTVPAQFAHCENAFILDVKGDSMIDAGILSGDMIIVQPNVQIINGDIVVAMIQDECSDEAGATVKRFFKEEGRVRLQPENQFMEPIFATDVTILGKVVGLMRRL
jgi:repressor LexA